MHRNTVMKTHRRLAQALVLLLTLLVSGAGAMLPGVANAGQANGNSYVSKTTGETVAWDVPWSYDSQDSTTTAGSEVVFLNSDVALVLLGFLPTGIDMNQARDQVLAEFQKDAANFTPIDRGSYSNVSYSLDMAAIRSSTGQSTEFGIFTLFMVNTGKGATEVDIFMAPVAAFTQGLNSAKSAITVGGSPIFDGVTPGGLQNLLDKNVPSGGTTRSSNQSSSARANTPGPATTATASEPTRTPTEADSGGLGTGGLHLGGGNDMSGSSTKVSATKSASKPSKSSQGTVDPALKALGVTAAGKYTSPQFGAQVTWNESWTIAEDKQNKPVVTSDTSQGVDAIMLDCQTGDGFVFFSIAAPSQGSPAQYEQYWSSDTYFQKAGMVNAEVLDSTSTETDATVLIRHDASETNSAKLIELMQAHVTADGHAIVITRAVASLSNNIPDFFTAMASGLTVDGNPPMSTADAVRFVTEAAS